VGEGAKRVVTVAGAVGICQGSFEGFPCHMPPTLSSLRRLRRKPWQRRPAGLDAPQDGTPVQPGANAPANASKVGHPGPEKRPQHGPFPAPVLRLIYFA
jgi:hypothetical protein